MSTAVDARSQEDPRPVAQENGITAAESGHGPKPVCPVELRHIIEFPDLRGNIQVLPLESYQRRGRKKDPDSAFKDFPILLRRIVNAAGRTRKYQLEIQSDLLRKIFQDIARSFRELNATPTPS